MAAGRLVLAAATGPAATAAGALWPVDDWGAGDATGWAAAAGAGCCSASCCGCTACVWGCGWGCAGWGAGVTGVGSATGTVTVNAAEPGARSVPSGVVVGTATM